MAYRPSGGPSRGGREDRYPTPPYSGSSYRPADAQHHEVPYYQDPRDMGQRQYDDTYAFASPNSYNDWVGNGRPPRMAPASTMPQPRANFYRPPPPQYSSFSAAGPSTYTTSFHGTDSSDPYNHRSFSSSSRGAGPSRGGMPTSPGSSYVPPHKRGQTKSPPPHAPPQTGPASRERRATTPPFVIPLPDREYMNLSQPHIPSLKARTAAEAPKKLLVLDLNGTLIFRNKNSSNSRTAYPRPYLKSFLEYLLQKEEEGNNDGLGRWSVFVWSSAQPHNVRGMLESTFDPRHIDGLWDMEGPDKMASAYVKGKVLGVWSRDKMGLSAHEYANKTQTVKDLRNVAEHFTALEKQTNTRFRLQDILLLDDSPKKAVHQPWNQLVLPEFDKAAWHQSREAASRIRSADLGPDCDQYLLAIIGILEDLTTVSNIPAYIRAGGLKKPSVNDYASEWASSGRWQGTADGPAADEVPTLEQLPTYSEFGHWFQDQAVVDRWIEKGKEALEKRGIPLEHGVRLDNPGSQSPAPFSSHSTRQTSRAPTPGHTVPLQRRRGYSPSQPTQAAANQVDDEDLAGRARSLSFDNQSATPVINPRARSPLSRDQRPFTNGKSPQPASSGRTRPFSTSNPNPNINFAPVSEAFDPARPVDTWRTLRSADVSRWLSDIADRASSLDQQARTLLLHAGELLQTLGTDETWDRRMPEEMLRMGGWHDDMTNNDLARIGEVRALAHTRHMVEQAAANDMPPCVAWERYGSAQLPRLAAGIKRYVPEDSAGQPVIKKKKAKLVFNAVNAGHTADEVVELADIRPRGSRPVSPPAPPPPAASAAGANGDLPLHDSAPQSSTQTPPSQEVAVSRPTVDAGPSTIRSYDHDGAPRFDIDVGLVIDSEHGEIPPDYPSSRLELPPCKVHGVALTQREMAEIFYEVRQKNIPQQVGRLDHIRSIERLLRREGRKREKNVRDLKTAKDVRDTVVRIARDLRFANVTSDPIPQHHFVRSSMPNTANGGETPMNPPPPSSRNNLIRPAPESADLPARPDFTQPEHTGVNGNTNGDGGPTQARPIPQSQPQRPFNYRWCILDLPPCKVNGKVISADETAQMYEKARKKPSTSQEKRLREIRSTEDRVNNPHRSESARRADMLRVEMLRNDVVRVEKEHEKQRLAKREKTARDKGKLAKQSKSKSKQKQPGASHPRDVDDVSEDGSAWRGLAHDDEQDASTEVEWAIETRSQKAKRLGQTPKTEPF